MKIYVLKSVLPRISVPKRETLSGNLPPICDGTEDMRFIGHLLEHIVRSQCLENGIRGC